MMQEQARRYADAWMALKLDRLEALDDVTTDDLHFVDPFNDVRGRDALKAILAAMYRDLDAVRFQVKDVAVGNERAYLRWTFEGTIRRWNKPWRVEGMSELAFAEDGRVREHIDHWDSGRGFYAILPIFGAVIRFIRRRAGRH